MIQKKRIRMLTDLGVTILIQTILMSLENAMEDWHDYEWSKDSRIKKGGRGNDCEIMNEAL